MLSHNSGGCGCRLQGSIHFLKIHRALRMVWALFCTSITCQFTLEKPRRFSHNYIPNKIESIPKRERINYLMPPIISLKINNKTNTRQQGDGKKNKSIN